MGGLLFVEWGFHEFDDEFGDGERAFFIFEQIDQTLPSRLHWGTVSMVGQFPLYLLGLPLLLGNVHLQELDIVRH